MRKRQEIRNSLTNNKADLLEHFQTLPRDIHSILDLCWGLSHLRSSPNEFATLRNDLLGYYDNFAQKVFSMLSSLRYDEAQIILSFISEFNLPKVVFNNGSNCEIADLLVKRIFEDMADTHDNAKTKPVSLMALSLLFCSTFNLQIMISDENYKKSQTILRTINCSMFGHITSLELLYQVPVKLRTSDWHDLKWLSIEAINEKFDPRLIAQGGEMSFWRNKIRSVVTSVRAGRNDANAFRGDILGFIKF